GHHYREHVTHGLCLRVWRCIPKPDPGQHVHRYSHQHRQNEDWVFDGNIVEPHERNTAKFNGILKNKKQRKENRHWYQRWKASRKGSKGTRARIPIHFHYFLPLLLRLVFVLLLDFCKL